jgi:uncharacterized membrane protein
LAQELLGRPYAALTPVQMSVIDLICAEAPSEIATHLKLDDRTPLQKLADQVATVGGSWGFIFGFFLFLAAWILGNVVLLGPIWHRAFDPYPFIFLNLVLSMLAAIQAPVIMMSQNRASAKDRLQAEHDYMVNLRAELEIMRLHDKLDALRSSELEVLVQRQGETLELLRGEVRKLAGQASGEAAVGNAGDNGRPPPKG